MEENTRQKLISLLEQNLRKERCQEDEIVALKMQCTEYDAKLKDVTMELTNVKMQLQHYQNASADCKNPTEKVTHDPPAAEIPSTSKGIGTRPKITLRIAPPNELREPKRKRKGYNPDEWSCKECYRLLLEAEANGKIDRRRHDISMNFCNDHLNRFSYNLNEPPGFWNCNEMPPPRNGHLHPLVVPESNKKCSVDGKK